MQMASRMPPTGSDSYKDSRPRLVYFARIPSPILNEGYQDQTALQGFFKFALLPRFGGVFLHVSRPTSFLFFLVVVYSLLISCFVASAPEKQDPPQRRVTATHLQTSDGTAGCCLLSIVSIMEIDPRSPDHLRILFVTIVAHTIEPLSVFDVNFKQNFNTKLQPLNFSCFGLYVVSERS